MACLALYPHQLVHANACTALVRSNFGYGGTIGLHSEMILIVDFDILFHGFGWVHEVKLAGRMNGLFADEVAI